MSKEKPKIGGIGQQREQYTTIGGKRPDSQTSERRDVQEPERPDVETTKSQSTQEPENRSAQELKRPDSQTSERQDSQEPEHPDAEAQKRHTIYLPPKLSKWLKIYAVTTEQEISKVAAAAIQRYKDEIDPDK